MIPTHYRGFATACPKKQLVVWLFPILRSHSTDTKVHRAAVERLLAFRQTPLFFCFNVPQYANTYKCCTAFFTESYLEYPWQSR